jgi:hypothetical protein
MPSEQLIYILNGFYSSSLHLAQNPSLLIITMAFSVNVRINRSAIDPLISRDQRIVTSGNSQQTCREARDVCDCVLDSHHVFWAGEVPAISCESSEESPTTIIDEAIFDTPDK